MAIMLKIRWDITEGREDEFRTNQGKLCSVMSEDHPGVICYHVDYPAAGVSEWVEIYANDSVFKAHLANERGGRWACSWRPATRSTADVSGIRTRSQGRSSSVSERSTIRPPLRRSPSTRGADRASLV